MCEIVPEFLVHHILTVIIHSKIMVALASILAMDAFFR